MNFIENRLQGGGADLHESEARSMEMQLTEAPVAKIEGVQERIMLTVENRGDIKRLTTTLCGSRVFASKSSASASNRQFSASVEAMRATWRSR